MTLATSRPIRLRDTITAEIIKVATVPSTPIMLAVVLITNLALAVIDASKIGFYIQSDQTEPASISSFGMAMLAPVYAFLVVAAYAAASEYRDGQIRITLTAMPNRYHHRRNHQGSDCPIHAYYAGSRPHHKPRAGCDRCLKDRILHSV